MFLSQFFAKQDAASSTARGEGGGGGSWHVGGFAFGASGVTCVIDLPETVPARSIGLAEWFQSASAGTTTDVTAADNTQPWTLQQIADYLRVGYWSDRGTTPRAWDVSTDRIITVDVTGLPDAYKAAARQAMQTWTDVTGLQFQEVTSGADITFDDTDTGAYSSTSVFSSGYIASSSINVQPNWSSDPYLLQTFIHEIGHSLGLGHGSYYNGSATYGVDNLYANDSWQATVMSYFDQNENTYVQASFAYLKTPMLADIIAIRDIYGTTGETRTGDTTYGYNTNAGSTFSGAVLDDLGTNYSLVIVDDGGIDTIDLSQSIDNNRIDLTAGTMSDTGGLIGNIGIAPGVVIENAIGGSGNDTLIGNDADNRLTGGDGDDVLRGGAGTDTAVYSGAYADYAISTLGDVTTVVHAGGTDTLTGIEYLAFSDRTVAVGAGTPSPVIQSFTLSRTALAIGDSTVLTIVFSEAVAGFTVDDISGPAGSYGALNTTDGITYTVTFTPDAGAEIADTAFTIADGSYQSQADGTPGTGGGSGSLSIDTQAPTVSSIVVNDADGVLTGATTVTVTFSEAVTGFDVGDIGAPGSIDSVTSSDGRVWTVTYSPTADTEATGASLSIGSGFTDLAGNGGTGGSTGFDIDTLAPGETVSIDGVTVVGQDAVVSLSLSGALGAGEELRVYRDGVLVGVAAFGATGWSFTDSGLSAGSYAYSAVVVDAAGNSGTPSADYAFELGGSIFGTTGSDTVSGTNADDIISGLPEGSTSDGAGTIDVLTGRGGADLFLLGDGTRAYYDDGNDRSGNSGTTDYAVITDFGNGADRAEVTDEGHDVLLQSWSQDGWTGTGVFLDVNGNGQFDKKDELIAVLDGVDPSQLVVVDGGAVTTITRLSSVTVSIGSMSLDSGTAGDFVTNETSPSVSGTATAGATVTLTAGGLTLGTATADGNGDWTITYAGTLAEGDYTLEALAEKDGEAATDIQALTIDVTAPVAGTLSFADDTLTTGQSTVVTITFDEAVSGLAADDFTIDSGAGSLSGLSSSDGGVTWTATFTAGGSAVASATLALTGEYFDVAGNAASGGPSAGFSVEAGGTPAGDYYGTAGSDVYTGDVGDQTISGLPETGSADGAGTIDVLSGGDGIDTFIFGDAIRGAYYDDGNPRAGNTGKADYGHITDLDTNDFIQLYGAAKDYHYVDWTVNGVTGTAIIYDPDRDGYDAKDEMIGFLEGIDANDVTNGVYHLDFVL